MSNKIKIAVTGVGGGVGQSVIKSLYNTDYNIVGLDGELLGTGLFAVPNSYLIPYAKDSNYIPRLLEICAKEECKLLFPGLDAELMPLSLNKNKFEEIGTTVIVSRPEVIDISDNKLLTYEKLTPFGISVPKTLTFNSYLQNPSQVEFPLIVKQQIGGARSKNVYLLKNTKDFENLIAKKDFAGSEYIIQEYIEGDEYTCGTVNLDNKCKGVIVMKRTLRDGDTYKCFSVKNEVVKKEVLKVVDAIKPFGACNIQLRVRDGHPYIFEINARCSGTTASRTLCGFNEPKMIADFLLKGIQPTYSIKELSILRYWKELVVENDLVDELKENKSLTNKGYNHL